MKWKSKCSASAKSPIALPPRRPPVPKLAARFESLPDYPLALIPQKKRELLARGVDVIDLGAGDADLAPPASVLETIATAVHNPPMNRYGFGLGLVAYREAASVWMK